MASFRVVRCCDLDLTWRLFWFAAVLFVCAKVEAADRAWRNPDGGTFSSASNWSGGVPGASDVAGFGLSTPGVLGALPPYTVSFTADATNQSLRVLDDRVTFDLNGHVYTTSDASVAMQLGTVSGASGRLGVLDGIVILPFQSDLQIATTSGGSGLLAVAAGGLVIGSPELTVGLNGNGTLNIFDNGDLIADNTTIAANSGTTSTANITGSGSSLLASALVVGSGGNGTLNISASGRVDSTSGVLGDLAGSTGTANVDGANSRWSISGQLTLGNNGSGTLNITGGGVVQSTSGVISQDIDSHGTVTVSGTNSKWINSGNLAVGNNGNNIDRALGTLDIKDGGRLTNSGTLFVFGTLNITAGAMVENTNGDLVGGTAMVKGANSRWINSGDFNVGSLFATTLDITEGGTVQAVNGSIGNNGGGVFTVNVSGEGSQWINSGQLTLARDSSHLNISTGGLVKNTNAIISVADGGTNKRVSVAGLNARWINSGDLMLGVRTTLGNNGGGASLGITDGGRVQDVNAIIGENGNGAVTVSGVSSQWINSGELRIGRTQSEGSMKILAGGFVQNTKGFVGGTDSSTGDVLVTGADSRGATSAVAVSSWINSEELTIGQFGGATLSIEVGGVVSSATSYIAKLATARDSTATVGGTGAQWTINGQLFIGGREDGDGGDGTLRIRPGGEVFVAQDTRLFANDVLQLEGGTLSTNAIRFNGGGTFAWTSGTLHLGDYRGNLTTPDDGILAPGNSVGQTIIDGNYFQRNRGTLEIEIGGSASADLVDITGVADFSGNLQLKLLNGFVPSPASSFVVFDSRGINGAFLNVASGQRLETIDGLGSFLVNYGDGSPFDPTRIVLSNFLTAGLPGDYNQNGVVDAADYTLWRDHLGQTFTLTNGNPAAETPGVVDAEDYAFWKSQFGESLGSGSGAPANATVPEPTSRVLFMTVVLAMFVCRRVAVS